MFTPLTFILAGNYEEFVHYCQSHDLNRHDFVYLNKTAEGLRLFRMVAFLAPRRGGADLCGLRWRLHRCRSPMARAR